MKSIFSAGPQIGKEVVGGGYEMLKEYVKGIDEVVISFGRKGVKLQVERGKKK